MSSSEIKPVLIVGAGPTGMTAALDLAHYGIHSIILDDDHKLSDGSRAIAFHQSALAVWEKLGAAQDMLALWVAWWVRHTYLGQRQIYVQDFGKPAPGLLPRYINLPQYEVEHFLAERVRQNPLIELRWDQRVTNCLQTADQVTLTVETPEGSSEMTAEYVLACDGARSSLRKFLDLEFPGRTVNDFFLIADIRADLDFPPEPRFFFDHPTNRGNTILIHPQPQGIWRIDWQLGVHVDPELESTPEKMDRRIRALIGETPYQIVWLSHYRFHQRLLARLQHGRVFFAGDSAHLVAPFGARGMNSAIQDVENLAWKLAYVLKGLLPPALLDTYQAERWPAQAENQKVTINTMRFMAPDTPWLRLRRNLILAMSVYFPPVRRWVDSGKMSIPYVYHDTPLCVPDRANENWQAAPVPGAKLPDQPLSLASGGITRPGFLRRLFGSGFVAFYFAADAAAASDFLTALAKLPLPVPLKVYPVLGEAADDLEVVLDTDGSLARALDAKPGTLYLVRPDGHLAMRRRDAQAGYIITYLKVVNRS